jgi:hypothetical protein
MLVKTLATWKNIAAQYSFRFYDVEMKSNYCQ